MQTPTIAEAARLIAARKLSPVDLVEHCLSRTAALDNDLHSFITITADQARQDARAAESRMMAGTLRGRLDGIPIAHKDIYATRGIATTGHSRLLEHWLPEKDAHIVTLLAKAGTSMLGKLATHEFALGGPSFDLPWPPARNPWGIDRFTSGSSSGSAAAVAAGLVLGATGSDTGGSIREPAALCGVAGIKPTYGLCSRSGVLPLAFSLDHPGVLAWTVEDCAMLLQAVAGYDPADPASRNLPMPDFSAGLEREAKDVRIGVVPQWHETECAVSDAVRQGYENALAIWRGQGAQIVELDMPPLADYQATTIVIMLCEAFAAHEPWMREHFDAYGESLRDRIALGAVLSSADYLQALRRRAELCAATFDAALEVDVIATPGATKEAPRIDSVSKWGFLASSGFAKPFNVTGWPAVSVCSGFGEHGLPVAVQLAAKPFQEPLLFQVAHAFERAVDLRAKRPAILDKMDGRL
ncbi:amidase [Shinella sp. S4-D37]|uniref:amidase n=1 Tax=Shinella sp. S4-D37 TaxID=3161999 RepID=UPI00346610EF